jgi:hypothetical protein
MLVCRMGLFVIDVSIHHFYPIQKTALITAKLKTEENISAVFAAG